MIGDAYEAAVESAHRITLIDFMGLVCGVSLILGLYCLLAAAG